MLEINYQRVNSLGKNETITRPVFISKMEEKTTAKGNPYVSFKFSDSTASVDANMFQMDDGSPATIDTLANMGIKQEVLVTVTLTRNEKGFVNASLINTIIDPDVSIRDFAQVAEGSAEERFNSIIAALQSVNEEQEFFTGCTDNISKLAIEFYNINKEKLMWSAAAEMMHSEKAGGLMEHTEAMVRNALKLCEVYPDLDKELLVTAAALHDIGKLEELSTNSLGHATYTAKGIGLGHIMLGTIYIDRLAQKNPDKYPEDRIFLLESLIASHHGEKEYGSPVEPITIEGCMLNLIDEMDAKYHEYNREALTLNPGEISVTSRPLGINHRIYRPKEEGDVSEWI